MDVGNYLPLLHYVRYPAAGPLRYYFHCSDRFCLFLSLVLSLRYQSRTPKVAALLSGFHEWKEIGFQTFCSMAEVAALGVVLNHRPFI